MRNRMNLLKEKNAGQRNEATRIIAIVNTQLELSDLWKNAEEGENDYRRKALSKTALETAELYLIKAESL